MSNILFIDENILEDSTKWGENREIFQKAVTECIESNYSDDSQVYSLFTPDQRKLLDAYYKGFSREMYRELNGTVALQIQKRNENVKRKLKKLGDDFGMQIDADSWEYDGLRDVGKGAGAKCDLCPHPIRYVHYAVNKQTHECLQFGCNCAADFFAMDKGRLQAMHSIQANMLKDIKIIACIKDKHLESDYYRYMCGNFGRVYLEKGVQGLKELVTFKVFWADDEHLQGYPAKGTYKIQYGDGTTAMQTLEWIKQHIVSCINADLDNYSFKPLNERSIIPLQGKDMTERQKNTAQYIIYAINFVNAGIPVPPSIAKQVNAIVSTATKQHHPDYIRYAQELLMHKQLAKSSLLSRAFTDFIVDYLTSTARKTDRDPETACWGIKGPKTFYNTVLEWETAVTKLTLMQAYDNLVTEGYITAEEQQRYWRFPANVRVANWIGSYRQVTEYTAYCRSLFLNSGAVTRDDTRLRDGLSKYDVTGSKAALVVDNTLYKGDSTRITVNNAPYKIALCFITYQNGFKLLVQDTIADICKILEGVTYTENDTELAKYLYSISTNTASSAYIDDAVGAVQSILLTVRYSSLNASTVKESIQKYYKPEYDDDVDAFVTQYKKLLPVFRKACTDLYTELMTLYKALRAIRFVNVNKTDINNDYEALMSADRSKNKTSMDYFKDYCKMLNGKRVTPKMQQYLHYRNFMNLLAYKKMKPYAEMLTQVYTAISSGAYKQAEAQLSKYLRYATAREVLNPIAQLDRVEPFTNYIITECVLRYASYAQQVKLVQNKDVRLKHSIVFDNFDRYFNKGYETSLLQEIVFETLKPVLRNDCAELLTSIKQAYTIFKPGLTAKELIKATGREKTYNKNALTMAMTVQDIVNAIDVSIKPFPTYSTGHMLFEYLNALQYFPKIAEIMERICKTFEKYMAVHGDELVEKIENLEKQRLERAQKALEDAQKTVHLKDVLNEHIKFFEVEVTDALKRKYHNTKETAIRRREAFKLVKFESGADELSHFLRELKTAGLGNVPYAAVEYVQQAETLLQSPEELQDKQQVKALVNTLRAVLYNQKRIYNHYDLTHRVLKEFAEIDFTKMTDEDIKCAESILSVYYLCASDVEKLYSFILEYKGESKINYIADVQALPQTEDIDINAVYNSYIDNPDSTGLTGVQKAEQVFTHSGYDTMLDAFEKKVVNTVYLKKTCSAKQLTYINNAYNKLFGNTDTTAQTVHDKVAVDSSVTANVELAEQILNHPDFETLPDTVKRVVKTVASSKATTPKCSTKQLYYVEKAKTVLKV